MEMGSEYWDAKAETMPLEELKKLQLERIKQLVRYAYNNSPFYHRRFDEAGVKPEDIKTLHDFREKIPIFRKDDLREESERTGDPFAGMLTVPIESLDTIHPSTGTTGAPSFTAFTAEEGEGLGDLTARYIWMAKQRPGMRLIDETHATRLYWHWWTSLWAKAYDRIPGEFIDLPPVSFLLGVPLSEESIVRFKADHAMLVTDRLAAIIDECAKKGIEPKDIISAKYVRTAGEAISPTMRKRIMEKFGAEDLFDIHGVSDPLLLDVDCYAHEGKHVWADYYFIEVIDPDTGELLGPHEPGEIVATNLIMKSVPWIRYGTEDFGELIEESCKCGRTHPRINIFDRIGWVLDIAGKKISPYNVRTVMEKYPETEEANFNLLKYEEKMEKLRMKACYNPMITKDPEGLKGKLVADLKTEYGIDAEIEWVAFEEIAKILHKVMRVVDITKT